MHRTPSSRPPVAAFLAVATVSLAIPVAVIAHNTDTQARRGPGGLKLSAVQQTGREVFSENCATCHTLAAANAVGRVGPSLDQVLAPLPMEVRGAFVKEAVISGRANGNGQMPADLLTADDRHAVIVFLRKAVPPPPAEPATDADG